MTLQRAGSRRRPVNIQVLPSASNVIITGGSFTGVQQMDGAKEIEGFAQNNPLAQLYAHAVPNAMLSAGGRTHDVKCHPGTRKEVIRIIEKWIDRDEDQSRSIFSLSGPAGAGKTAIIQTVAERCMQRGVPTATYFCLCADSTRSHPGSLVATLLYQILQFYPKLRPKIAALLGTNPLIFDQSTQDQIKYLIDVRSVVSDLADTNRLVLLVDSLEDYSPKAKHLQRDVLLALHHLSSQKGSPFAVLVASCPEAHLRMVFNEIGSSIDSIFLSEEYHPSDDIRMFVKAEFDRIKKMHPLGPALDHNWPSEAIVNEIVDSSSGHFIRPASIMHFIAAASASPAHSLDRVRGIRPTLKISPFADLDDTLTSTLSQAEDWQSARDIMASQLILLKVAEHNAMIGHSQRWTICTLIKPLRLTESDIESSLADLAAVVQYNRETKDVTFYHSSLQDFFHNKSRSKSLYIDLESFKAKLAAAHIPAISSFDDMELFCSIFSLVRIATPSLKVALISWEPWRPARYNSAEDQRRMWITGHRFVFTLWRLLSKNDDLTYQTVLHKWLAWFFDVDISRRDLPKVTLCKG